MRFITALLVIASTTLAAAAQTAGDDAATSIDRYLRYAMEHDGDADAGRDLFENHQDLLCRNCHRMSGIELSGPNLAGIADKYDRRELIRQVLLPSEQIKPGFEQVVLVTDAGRVFTGRIERANRNLNRIIDAQGRQTDVPTSQITRRQVVPISLMPANIHAVLTEAQFADLIAYLRTLTFGVREGLLPGGVSIDIPHVDTPVTFRPIHPEAMRFENPVWVGALPGTESDLIVVEHQSAKVWRTIRDGDGNITRRELFADLTPDIFYSSNQGVMCIAFHPDYKHNRRYFVKHEVQEGTAVKSTIVERLARPDGLADSGKPSVRLLEVEQPAFNHNGGCLAFGPDGMLYTAFGDGGPQRDPPGFSQNPRILHGSMLRIDVNRIEDGKPYAIPPDNPFLDAHDADPAVRPETWAIGLREPWRFSFDPATGELYVGDVGQDRFEEVSLVRRGENHGWNVREAFEPFSDEYRRPGTTYTEPIFAYSHAIGASVTGGYVYRGGRNASFDGVYIFGDYNSRLVWGLRQSGGRVSRVVELGTAPGGIASFGVDQQGEIYLVTYSGYVYHVDLAGSEFPGP